MSKTYEVKLGVEEGEDHHKSRLQILPIVPQVPEILGEELEKRGWSVSKKGVATKKFGEATAKVDTTTGEVEMQAKAKVALVGKGYDVADNRQRGEAKARAEGEARRGKVKEEAKARAEKALLEVSEDIRAETGAALRDTTIRALRIKAESLGSVVSETNETNSRGERVFKIQITV